MSLFKLHLPFQPAGDQEAAIKKLQDHAGKRSTLLGVTGSGKTFTIANVIARQSKPVVVLSPNKTLAAQLYEEFSLFFPKNKVCYFVSYYDYYQPESYLPAQDIYIPKETKINPEIERLRVEAAAALMQRDDVIIIASVSCIYSLGNPDDFEKLAVPVSVGQTISRTQLLHQLIFILYQRNDIDRKSGTFAVQGNTIEVRVPYEKHKKLRIDMFGDTIEEIAWVDVQNNTVIEQLTETVIFPARYFVTTEDKKVAALQSIRHELQEYTKTMDNELYKERIIKRVSADLEMIEQTGSCNGIENYSIHFDGRLPGNPPFCLFDFFEKDKFLLIIDESHIALPQLHAMYNGDRARKKALIDFAFRLPSAYDNRPLQFEETERFFSNVIFVSATPGKYELAHSDQIVEQIIRPTGLLDPVIEVRPRTGQVQDVIAQIKATSEKGFRSLVTVLTKKMAEEFAYYLEEQKLKVCYLHSEMKTPQRTEILQKLRLGVFECVVGVNLLREGLDLPEVAFVAVMDADVEGFLRDQRSLIQIVGRAARNTESVVYFYADKMTPSMQFAISETLRRRAIQQEYNEQHGITPRTVTREVKQSITGIQQDILHASSEFKKAENKLTKQKEKESQSVQSLSESQRLEKIVQLEAQMQQAAQKFDFETAIKLREEWQKLRGE